MASVKIRAIVDETRQLHLTVPDDFPTGPVEVTITSAIIVPPLAPGEELTRERLRALLAAEGALVTTRYAPPDAKPLSEEEREEYGRLAPCSPDTLEIINEGRGPR